MGKSRKRPLRYATAINFKPSSSRNWLTVFPVGIYILVNSSRHQNNNQRKNCLQLLFKNNVLFMNRSVFWLQVNVEEEY